MTERIMLLTALCCAGAASWGWAQPEPSTKIQTIEVTIELNTGGGLRGTVIDSNSHGLVLLSGETPFVYSWDELDALSSFAVQRQLMFRSRNGLPLSAEQHLRLGAYALHRGKRTIAHEELTEAVHLDSALQPQVQQLIDQHKPRPRNHDKSFPRDTEQNVKDDPMADDSKVEPRFASMGAEVMPSGAQGHILQTPAEVRDQVLEIYRRYGQEVQKVIGKQVALVETEHFLVWSDWAKAENPMLGEWCERMYAQLAREFAIPPDQSVFLAKCPVFAFRSPNRFRKFARSFDGYDAGESAGYTRSIELSGHVHLALLRFGDSESDYDQFAWTLVHEGTHAFLHRWHATRLIPHWVNEGIAERTAQRVLGNRCPAEGNARLLARQYVHFDWPIRDMLENAGPIEVHQYPVAHSVIAYLDSLGTGKLAVFVRGLKEGQSIGRALADQWEGMTVESLEKQWRNWVGDND